VSDREVLETYSNSASKNTIETDLFSQGTKPLLTTVICYVSISQQIPEHNKRNIIISTQSRIFPWILSLSTITTTYILQALNDNCVVDNNDLIKKSDFCSNHSTRWPEILYWNSICNGRTVSSLHQTVFYRDSNL